MTEISSNHPLVQRIGALRQRLRLFLAVYGVGALLLTFAAIALVFPFVDYLFHFRAGVRLAGDLLAVASLLMIAWRYLIRPLSAKLSDQFLASRVENIHQPLADEITAALDFISNQQQSRNALAARAVETATANSNSIRFESALRGPAAARPLSAAAVLLALVALIALLSPSMASIAFARWADPFGAHDWPRVTHVAFQWPQDKAPTVQPLGDPLAVRAVVSAGGSASMRVFLYVAADGQTEERQLMNYQAGQSDPAKGLYVYEKQIEPAGQASVSLRLEAGDDTEQEPLSIRLSPRPQIAGMTAQVTPPAYAKAMAGRSYDLLSQVARAVEGSTVVVTLHSSKPLQNAGDVPEVAIWDAARDQPIPLVEMQRKLLDPATATITFRAEKSLEFRGHIVDTDGFANRVGGSARLDVVPDALPTVALTEPRRPMEVVPQAVIPIQIQSTDDLGLADLYLQADNFDAKPTDKPRLHQALQWLNQTPDAATMSVTGSAAYEWNLADLNLKPGDRLSFYAVVRDNYAMPMNQFLGGAAAIKDPFEKADDADAVRHRLVRSAPLSLTIETKERIEENTRKELQEIRDQIRRLNEQQTTANQQTRAIQKAADQAGVTTEQQRQQLAELASQQANMAQRAMGIAGRVDQVRQSMQINQMAESELGKMAAQTSSGMTDVGQTNMPRAAADLSRAQESAGRKDPANQTQQKQAAQDTAADSGKAADQQELAMSTMSKLIDQLGAAGDFEAARSKVNQILDEQKTLEKNLRDQAASTLGKPLNQLSPQEKANLDKIAADQDKLAQETSKLTESMDKTADQLNRTDPASSESLRKAAQVSRDQQVAGNQSSAASNTGSNQMSNASNSMTQARRGLEDMKNELDQQNRRQLEQLALQLQQLLESLKDLRAKQLALNDDTTKAGAKAPAEDYEGLGNRESRIQGNTIAEAQRAENLRDGRPAASDLHDAADAMGSATALLMKADQPTSIAPEKKALASLDAAIKKLEEQKKKVDDQLRDQDLASLRKQYEEIKTGQEGIKTASDDLSKKLNGKDPQRTDLAAMSTQANTQAKLITDLRKVAANPELAKSDVLVWMNQQIVDNMTTSRQRLDKAQLGRPLAEAQGSAIDQLDQIIEALKEEQKKPSEFAGGGGQGGGGGGGKPPLLPPTAQLKLLKSQQVRLNATTVETDQKLTAASSDADKGQLKQQAEELGDRQAKIKDLAQKVVDGMKQ